MSSSTWNTRDKVITSLFLGFCGLILAAAIYWSGLIAGYQEGKSSESAARHEANIEYQVEQVCAALTGASLVKCVYNTTSAAEQARRSEQDLDAQQGMERWAFWMFFAAILQTVVASAALFFLMKDLRQNRSAGEIQMRAYPTIVAAKYLVAERFFVESDVCSETVEFDINNSGSTPIPSSHIIATMTVWPPADLRQPVQEHRVVLFAGPLRVGLSKGVRVQFVVDTVNGESPLQRGSVFITATLVHNDVFNSEMIRKTRQSFRKRESSDDFLPDWTIVNATSEEDLRKSYENVEGLEAGVEDRTD